jgi:hypothetical protein
LLTTATNKEGDKEQYGSNTRRQSSCMFISVFLEASNTDTFFFLQSGTWAKKDFMAQ